MKTWCQEPETNKTVLWIGGLAKVSMLSFLWIPKSCGFKHNFHEMSAVKILQFSIILLSKQKQNDNKKELQQMKFEILHYL